MELTQILPSDLIGKGVVGQSDTPGLSALEMQNKVEEIVRTVVIPNINENVQAINNYTAQNDQTLGQKANSTDVTNQIAQAVQEAENYTDTQVAPKANSTDVTNQINTALQTAKNYTDAAEQDAIQAAKNYTDSVALAAGAVTSVFGRSGAVVPQSGDYTADQITPTTNNQFVSSEQKTNINAIPGIQNSLADKADKPAVFSVTLSAAGWTEANGIYQQTFTVPNGDATTQVCFDASPSVLSSLSASIVAVNVNGVFSAMTTAAPSADITLQVTAYKTSGSGTIYGNYVGGGSSILYGAEDLEDGVTPLAEGVLYCVY